MGVGRWMGTARPSPRHTKSPRLEHPAVPRSHTCRGVEDDDDESTSESADPTCSFSRSPSAERGLVQAGGVHEDRLYPRAVEHRRARPSSS